MKFSTTLFTYISKQQLLVFALCIASIVTLSVLSVNRYAVIKKQIASLQEQQSLSGTTSDRALAYAEAVRNSQNITMWSDSLGKAMVPYSNPFLLVASIEELAKSHNVTVQTDVVSPNGDGTNKVSVVPVALIVNGTQANTMAFVQALNSSTLHFFVHTIAIRPGNVTPASNSANITATIELDSYWFSL